LNPCLEYDQQYEDDDNTGGGQDDVLYEEPDLSGGVEGVDYGFIYGVDDEMEQ
jgi:hypothetical protein